MVTPPTASAEVEVSVDRNRLAVTRFANSVIHQNVADDIVGVRVRVHRNGRTASGSSTLVAPDGLRALVDRTLTAVAVAPADPGWPGLAPPAPVGPTAVVDRADGRRHARRPGGRRRRLRRRGGRVGGRRVLPDQPLDRRLRQLRRPVRHWRERRRRRRRDRPARGRRRRGPGGFGADDRHRRRAARPPGGGQGTAAADPVELAPDRYEVVLEPTAVADILETLSLYGFNAKAVEERRSFVRVGDAQFDPSVTVVDDAAGGR